MLLTKIPHSVVERLGWYVYSYVHRKGRRIHYIGKGTGQRALNQLMCFHRHQVDILAHGLKDEVMAYVVERALIDGLGLPRLVNKVRGKGARQFGREPLEDLIYHYTARRIDIDEMFDRHTVRCRDHRGCVVAPDTGRPAHTCEAHRSRQENCHSRRLFLSGTPATASA